MQRNIQREVTVSSKTRRKIPLTAAKYTTLGCFLVPLYRGVVPQKRPPGFAFRHCPDGRSTMINNKFLLLCELAVRAKHIYNLVDVHLLHCLAGRCQILTWVEVTWVLSQILADSSCHGKTRV